MSSDDEWIVVDTDCGTDDAMAIVLALSGERASRILAFTCCFGNTTVDNACSNVMRVLTHCRHKEIPVYRGSCCPLLSSVDEPGLEVVHGSDGFGDCSAIYPTGGRQVSEDPAAWKLVQLSRQYPKQITLVALAPLTNLALAHRIDPTFTERLKSIVCMGGNYKGIGNVTEAAEYNFYCDPVSAHIVLSEVRCPVVLVPWETTMDYGIEWDEYQRLMTLPTPKARFLQQVTAVVADFCRTDGCTKFYDCDLVAMAVALYPDLITDILQRSLAVECAGGRSKGLTVSLREAAEGAPKISVVIGMDQGRLDKLREQMLTC